MELDKNTQAFLDAANHYRCRVTNYFELHGFALDLGNRRYFFRGAATPFNNSSCIDVTNNKFVMNRILNAGGVPVPEAIAMSRDEYKKGEYSLDGLKYPLVAKPTMDTGVGRGVLCNIPDLATLREYLDRSFDHYRLMSVESFKANLQHYRVTIFMGKVIGVLLRDPASVTGDGKHTIKELIEKVNAIRCDKMQKTTMQPISIDQEMDMRLKELELSLDSVPKDGEKVTLCYTNNSSRGGNIVSLGKQIHPDNVKLARQVCRLLGVKYCGIDLACTDIMQPVSKTEGYIIEVNYNPDISIHTSPLEGPPTLIARNMIRHLILKHPFSYLRKLLRLELIIKRPIVRFAFLVAIFFIIRHYFF